MNIQLGKEVAVVANNSKHGFEIGEIVIRVASLHDTEEKQCFYSELYGTWHLLESDYVVMDVQEMSEEEKVIDLLKRAKKYVSRVNSIGSQALSNEIANYLKEKVK